MRRRLLAVLSAGLLVLGAVACTSNGPAEPNQTPPTIEPTPSPTPYDPVFPKGARVAFFGDSQATMMLRPDRTPPWLAEYLTPVDKSIEGCGILLGKVR